MHEPTQGTGIGGDKTHHVTSIEQELVTILYQEADSINHIIKHFPSQAVQLVEQILQTLGKVVFTGNGKSGLIARKLAATFSSLGTPSCFLHPSDALHGDLGMIQKNDLIIILSKSGTGFEFDHIIRFSKSQNIFIGLLCCDQGPLSNKVNLTIILPLKKEACHLNLAPTNSSTVMIAFGDALAIVLSKLKAFDKNNFACFHPAGTLGKKLLLRVSALMYARDGLPLLSPDTSFQEVIVSITSKKLGTGIVVDAQQKLLGVITDGDLRRACALGLDVFTKTSIEIMTPHPKSIPPDMLAHDALLLMEKHNITSLVVAENQKVVGLIHIHDIIKTGLKG